MFIYENRHIATWIIWSTEHLSQTLYHFHWYFFGLKQAAQVWMFHTWMGKKHLCFFQTAETENRNPEAAVLITTLGPPPIYHYVKYTFMIYQMETQNLFCGTVYATFYSMISI